MKDFISKLTFGFLMAQFVPGAITTCSITFLYAAFNLEVENSMKLIIETAICRWYNNTLLAKLFFISMCTGAGMLIHGIHWAVLAHLETFCTEQNGQLNRRNFYETFWHKFPVFVQILLGPITMTVEILAFLLTGRKIKNLATHENVPEIKKDKMEAFNFVQEFYLNFAQFYAHTSYALLILLISLTIFVCYYGSSKIRICILIMTYILTGLFFVIGRIQLATLFIAEREIKEASS